MSGRRRSLLAASHTGGSNLITFTIDTREYQAEEGMTWGEWVDSEYNTGDFVHNGLHVTGSWVLNVSGNQIDDDTILYNGDFYSLFSNPNWDY